MISKSRSLAKDLATYETSIYYAGARVEKREIKNLEVLEKIVQEGIHLGFLMLFKL